jgi:hypothetical protein
MTTPRVTELPRRLEPSSPDTFLRGCGEAAPLAVVVQLRPRDPLAPRRSATARRNTRTLRPVAWLGPDAAA